MHSNNSPSAITFGIPGVHNTEIYDELDRSDKIHPVLVTHEASGAFIADAISRTSGGQIGCLLIVPAAGMTHAHEWHWRSVSRRHPHARD